MFHKKDTILSLSLKQLLPIRKSQPGVFVLVYFISNRNWVIWTAVLGKKTTSIITFSCQLIVLITKVNVMKSE